MSGVHYNGLSGYKSYDLAWLGPIVYPLTFAVIAQAAVFYDMARRSCCRGKKSLDWLVPRSARQETGAAAAPDARITLLVLIVMASEAIFAILCLVQCAINFTARSFPGGGGACDFQAFYAAMEKRGFVIFPGRLTAAGTFRLGVMGDLDESDMTVILQAIDESLAEIGVAMEPQ